MSRKELLAVLREILRLTVIVGDDMTAEEKLIRIKHLLIDALTENSHDAPLKFEAE